jgi:CRISPR-associated endoribonuclease Cas6
MLADLHSNQLMPKICELIDSCFEKDTEFLNWHSSNQYKNYSFSGLTPLERDKIYTQGKIYSFQFRTIDETTGQFIRNFVENAYTKTFKVLTVENKILPQIQLEKIYSVTPVVLKTDNGYWRSSMSLDDFERRLKENLIKKYNAFFQTKMDENFQLFNHIRFDNRVPIKVPYKNINLLGDKLTLILESNQLAQELGYLALGTSLGEMGARGFGFCNYKYI